MTPETKLKLYLPPGEEPKLTLFKPDNDAIDIMLFDDFLTILESRGSNFDKVVDLMAFVVADRKRIADAQSG